MIEVLPVVTRSDRRAVEIRAYAVRHDDSVVDLRVVDLSHDGCAVETNERLVPGELLNLSVLSRGFVKTTDRKAGLRFDADCRSNEYAERRAERIQAVAEIALRRSGRLGYPVRTSDLTRMGCKCEFVDRPAIGERVWVKFAGSEALHAEVCWLAESNVGLQFKTPIHPAVFDLLLARLQL